jgi:hypothetical protein
MASLRKIPGSRYWIACFTVPGDARKQRSTKEVDRRRAQRIADQYEEAARLAGMGRLAERQARQVIGEIYRISNRQELPSQTISEFFAAWVAVSSEALSALLGCPSSSRILF